MATNSGVSDRQKAVLNKERERNRVEVEKFLAERKIKSERVLGYVCFAYKGKHHRVGDVFGVKRAMDIPI